MNTYSYIELLFLMFGVSLQPCNCGLKGLAIILCESIYVTLNVASTCLQALQMYTDTKVLFVYRFMSAIINLLCVALWSYCIINKTHFRIICKSFIARLSPQSNRKVARLCVTLIAINVIMFTLESSFGVFSYVVEGVDFDFLKKHPRLYWLSLFVRGVLFNAFYYWITPTFSIAIVFFFASYRVILDSLTKFSDAYSDESSYLTEFTHQLQERIKFFSLVEGKLQFAFLCWISYVFVASSSATILSLHYAHLNWSVFTVIWELLGIGTGLLLCFVFIIVVDYFNHEIKVHVDKLSRRMLSHANDATTDVKYRLIDELSAFKFRIKSCDIFCIDRKFILSLISGTINFVIMLVQIQQL